MQPLFENKEEKKMKKKKKNHRRSVRMPISFGWDYAGGAINIYRLYCFGLLLGKYCKRFIERPGDHKRP